MHAKNNEQKVNYCCRHLEMRFHCQTQTQYQNKKAFE